MTDDTKARILAAVIFYGLLAASTAVLAAYLHSL